MNKLRLGIVGTGSVVREIYRHLYFNSRFAALLSVEAVADVDEAARDEFCEQYKIPAARRYTDYQRMIDDVGLDAVAVNTPDSLHRAPAVYALEHGLDVVLPKPLASTVADARSILDAARRNGRLVGVDFHKREDPRIRETARRYQSGAYGELQTTVWYMLDKLLVADPNHQPRFFATTDFAARNSPISFLTVHMADALMQIARLKPVRVRATGYTQRLPALRPIAVPGYDLCATEVLLENGALAHILTGWHLPNKAHALTVQSARLICTQGLIDLGLDTSGLRETVDEGIRERNTLFLRTERDGSIGGYGVEHPGALFMRIQHHRRGLLAEAEQQQALGPFETGFYATVICEAAERSLSAGTRTDRGAVRGAEVDVAELVQD